MLSFNLGGGGGGGGGIYSFGRDASCGGGGGGGGDINSCKRAAGGGGGGGGGINESLTAMIVDPFLSTVCNAMPCWSIPGSCLLFISNGPRPSLTDNTSSSSLSSSWSFSRNSYGINASLGSIV